MHTDREAVARARYDFARDGGKEGDITLRGDAIPEGAVILDSLIEVETALDSAEDAATIALKAESAADLQAAKKSAEAPWSEAGVKRGGLTATSAPVAATARREITATVATEDLTAGEFTAYVRFLLPHA